jgi:hypothetical protein
MSLTSWLSTSMLKNLNPSTAADGVSATLKLVLLFFSAAWVAAIIVAAVYSALAFSAGSEFTTVLPLKFLRATARLTAAVLFMPLATMLISIYKCAPGATWAGSAFACFGTEHSLLMALVTALLPFFFGFSLCVSAVFIDRDYRSTNVVARAHGRVSITMISIKTLVTLVFTVGAELPPLLLQSFLLLMGALWLAAWLRHLPMLTPWVNQAWVAVGAVFLWASACAVLGTLLDNPASGVAGYLFFAGTPIAAYCGYATAVARFESFSGAPGSGPPLRTPYDVELRARYLMARAARAGGSGGGSGGGGGAAGAAAVAEARRAAVREARRLFASSAAARGAGSAVAALFHAEFLRCYAPGAAAELAVISEGLSSGEPAIDVRFLLTQARRAVEGGGGGSGGGAAAAAAAAAPASALAAAARGDRDSLGPIQQVQFDQFSREAEVEVARARAAELRFWRELRVRPAPDVGALHGCSEALSAALERAEGAFAALLLLLPRCVPLLRAFADFLRDVKRDGAAAAGREDEAEECALLLQSAAAAAAAAAGGSGGGAAAAPPPPPPPQRERARARAAAAAAFSPVEGAAGLVRRAIESRASLPEPGLARLSACMALLLALAAAMAGASAGTAGAYAGARGALRGELDAASARSLHVEDALLRVTQLAQLGDGARREPPPGEAAAALRGHAAALEALNRALFAAAGAQPPDTAEWRLYNTPSLRLEVFAAAAPGGGGGAAVAAGEKNISLANLGVAFTTALLALAASAAGGDASNATGASPVAAAALANGAGAFRAACNASAFLVLARLEAAAGARGAWEDALLAASAACLLALPLLVVLPLLRAVFLARQDIFAVFAELPDGLLAEMEGRCEEAAREGAAAAGGGRSTTRSSLASGRSAAEGGGGGGGGSGSSGSGGSGGSSGSGGSEGGGSALGDALAGLIDERVEVFSATGDERVGVFSATTGTRVEALAGGGAGGGLGRGAAAGGDWAPLLLRPPPPRRGAPPADGDAAAAAAAASAVQRVLGAVRREDSNRSLLLLLRSEGERGGLVRRVSASLLPHGSARSGASRGSAAAPAPAFIAAAAGGGGGGGGAAATSLIRHASSLLLGVPLAGGASGAAGGGAGARRGAPHPPPPPRPPPPPPLPPAAAPAFRGSHRTYARLLARFSWPLCLLSTLFLGGRALQRDAAQLSAQLARGALFVDQAAALAAAAAGDLARALAPSPPLPPDAACGGGGGGGGGAARAAAAAGRLRAQLADFDAIGTALAAGDAARGLLPLEALALPRLSAALLVDGCAGAPGMPADCAGLGGFYNGVLSLGQRAMALAFSQLAAGTAAGAAAAAAAGAAAGGGAACPPPPPAAPGGALATLERMAHVYLRASLAYAGGLLRGLAADSAARAAASHGALMGAAALAALAIHALHVRAAVRALDRDTKRARGLLLIFPEDVLASVALFLRLGEEGGGADAP